MSVRSTSAVWFASKSTGTTKLVLLAIAEAMEAWNDGRYAKEFNQWLFADFPLS